MTIKTNIEAIMASNTSQLTIHHQQIMNKGMEAVADWAIRDMYRWRNCFGRPDWFPTFEEAAVKVIEHSRKMSQYMDADRFGFLYHVASGGNGYTREDARGLSAYLYEDDPYSEEPEYKVRESGYILLYSVFEGVPDEILP